MIPGMKQRRVSPMLINKSTPHPFSSKTPRGGKMKANNSLQMSLHVKAIPPVRSLLRPSSSVKQEKKSGKWCRKLI